MIQRMRRAGGPEAAARRDGGRRRVAGRLRCALASCLVFCGAAAGQETPEPAQEEQQPAQVAPAPQPSRPRYTETLSGRPMEHILADDLAREALMLLRRSGSPVAEDYRLAALGLRAALRLTPDDEHLWRRLAEAQRQAGDEAGELASLRRVLELSPEDTVTQLRLLNEAIRSRQTVEGRLKAYERLLGSAGSRLDEALRSRLALDGALLAREAGDERRFVDLLTRAVQLDPTNKPAAVAASGYALSRLDDPMARVEALVNVVLADPVDPEAHMDLARELLSHGAFRGAERFFTRALEVNNRSGRSPTAQDRTQLAIVDWALEGADTIFERFDDIVAAQRYAIEQRQKAVDEGDLPPEEAPAPYRPTRWLEEVRLAAALGADNEEQADKALEALAELDELRRQELDAHRAEAAGDEEMDAEQREAADRQRRQERARVIASSLLRRLWAGVETADAEGLVASIEAAGGVEAAPLIRAWIDLREGRLEAAREGFAPLSPGDPRAAAGLGMSYEIAGETVEAARRYALIVRDAPGTLLGMWARERIERLLEQPLRPTPTARELNEYAMALPSALDRMTSNPSSYIDLTVEHVRERIGIFGRVEARLTLRNTGTMPLAVGDDAPLNSRVLLAPQLTMGGRRILEGLTPEVVSLSRRLRLTPGESMEVVYWAGQGATGRMIDRNPPMRATLGWRAMQGFGARPGGGYATGAMSVSASSGLMQRTAPPESQMPAETLVQQVREGEGEPRMRALAMAIWLLNNGGNLSDEEERFQLRTQMAEAIAGAWPTMRDAERAWAILRTRDSLEVPESEPIEEAAYTDPGPHTLLALLMSRGLTFPDRTIPLAAASEDDLTASLAKLYRLAVEGVEE